MYKPLKFFDNIHASSNLCGAGFGLFLKCNDFLVLRVISLLYHRGRAYFLRGGGKLGGANWRWGLLERENLFKTGEAALGNSFYFNNGITEKNSI